MKSALPAARRRAGRIAGLLMLAGTAALSAGCSTSQSDVTGTVPYPTDYRKRHPIVLKESDRTVEILVGSSRGGLTAAQRADVLAFAHEWRREGSGGIVIDAPAATRNEAAAADSVREIRAILNAAGVPERGVVVKPYASPDPAALAPIKLNYPRIAGEVGPCGTWPSDLGPSADSDYRENRPYWNLGCATQRNLAAMVENPADLVQPRGETPAPAGRRSVVLDKYRKGETTATAADANKDQGKISDVGR